MSDTLLPPEDLEPVWPGWFRSDALALRNARNVQKGLHPFGFNLHPDATLRCRGCAHVRVRLLGGRYLKCAMTNMSAGPATDVRLKWRACENYQPKEA